MLTIKIIHSCLGKNADHLEAGTVLDYDAETARTLIKFGRAVAINGEEEVEPVSEPPAIENALDHHTKAELVEIAESYDIKGAARLNKAELIEAISIAQKAA